MNAALHNTDIDKKKRSLTLHFCLAGIVAVLIVSSIAAFVSYVSARSIMLSNDLSKQAAFINKRVIDAQDQQYLKTDIPKLQRYWLRISQFEGVKSAAVFDISKNLLWSSAPQVWLSDDERTRFDGLMDSTQTNRVSSLRFPHPSSLSALFGDTTMPVSGLIPLGPIASEPLGMLKLVSIHPATLRLAGTQASRIFWLTLLTGLLVFMTLLLFFKRSLKTIDQQEIELNQQISKLSSFLTINKNLQQSMRTASSRAVELNEQFLRRVGADLHDGPAQSIGYAVMRLDKISRTEEAKSLQQDFHAACEALSGALTEIRGVCTGLVLPELEQMTLQQSLQQVVSRHKTNAHVEVLEFYQNLPEQIAMPIKICAYRLIQEGLNNAHRHGQAEKCRVAASVKEDVLHLSLKDNGMGFRLSKLSTDGGHLGLMGLKDRIESLGGTFTINSELGVGTAIKVTLGLVD